MFGGFFGRKREPVNQGVEGMTTIQIQIMPTNLIVTRVFFGPGNLNEQGDRLASVSQIMEQGGLTGQIKKAVITRCREESLPGEFGNQVIKQIDAMSKKADGEREVMDAEDVFSSPVDRRMRGVR